MFIFVLIYSHFVYCRCFHTQEWTTLLDINFLIAIKYFDIFGYNHMCCLINIQFIILTKKMEILRMIFQ